MANPIKGLLEVFEDMVEVLLVLEIFLTGDRMICCMISLGWLMRLIVW